MIDKSALVPEPGIDELRSFSFLMGSIIAVLFGLVLPLLVGHALPVWPWVIGAVFIGIGIVVPSAIRLVYHVWMRFGLLMSRIMNPLILGLIFYVMFLPVACIMRLINRDPLNRRFETDSESYRINRQSLKKENMENPF